MISRSAAGVEPRRLLHPGSFDRTSVYVDGFYREKSSMSLFARRMGMHGNDKSPHARRHNSPPVLFKHVRETTPCRVQWPVARL
jgi:hypothetical protein